MITINNSKIQKYWLKSQETALKFWAGGDSNSNLAE